MRGKEAMMTECTHTPDDGLQSRLPVTGRVEPGEGQGGYDLGNLQQCSVLWGSRTMQWQTCPAMAATL